MMSDDPQSPIVNIDLTVIDRRWIKELPSAEDAAVTAARAALLAGFSDPVQPARRLEISIVLSDDARVRQLNRNYRDQDKATNVLSFATFDAHEDILSNLSYARPLFLGDVVLARETLVREAAEQDKSAYDHLHHLIVHGALHLLGYNHQTDPEAHEMESLEVMVLAGLGIGNPYLLPDSVGNGCGLEAKS